MEGSLFRFWCHWRWDRDLLWERQDILRVSCLRGLSSLGLKRREEIKWEIYWLTSSSSKGILRWGACCLLVSLVFLVDSCVLMCTCVSLSVSSSHVFPSFRLGCKLKGNPCEWLTTSRTRGWKEEKPRNHQNEMKKNCSKERIFSPPSPDSSSLFRVLSSLFLGVYDSWLETSLMF